MVPNVKQQHEVNVGIRRVPGLLNDCVLNGGLQPPAGRHPPPHSCSNSFGFGGHNSVVAFAAYKP